VFAYPEFEATIHEFEEEFEPAVSVNGDVSDEPVPIG
jgi:hypothetical protein